MSSWLSSAQAAAAMTGDFHAHTDVAAIDSVLDTGMPTDAIAKRVVPLPDNPTRIAFVLDNVLTEAECKKLMDISEGVGYKPALVSVTADHQVMNKDYRNSDRCMIDSPLCAAEIFRRIRPHLPPIVNKKKLSGLNERLRFLRYGVGHKFAPHRDGSFQRRDAEGLWTLEESFFTIMIYLSNVSEGGSTRFLSSVSRDNYSDVIPRPGSVLIFEHSLLHQGSEVTKGLKYAIRSDIMYDEAK